MDRFTTKNKMATIEESTLKKDPAKMGLEPVSSVMSGAQAGAGPAPELSNQPSYSRFMASPIPLVATLQPDALRQFYRGGVPQSRIFTRNG
jgi:hypothetical protein